MRNQDKFFFSDFTLAEYEKLILLAKEHYNFSDYSSFNKDSNEILWRHDVDFSMHAALKLAEIENRANVKATYFLLLHSEFYNLLEKEISVIVKKIIQLGHDIGLHFDTCFYDINNVAQLENKLAFERDILTSLFDVPIKAFSFHNPFDFALSCQAPSYAGMINTYAKVFQSEVGYCSDSNGYWRHKRLKDFLKSPTDKSLQILTHPEWWKKDVHSPFEKVKMCVNGRAEKNLRTYINILEENGRENIDW